MPKEGFIKKCRKSLEAEKEVEVKEEFEFLTEDDMQELCWSERVNRVRCCNPPGFLDQAT